jgi:hypothetical protein
MSGWKGNSLGLQRWQVQHITAIVNTMKHRIEERMLAGDTFDEAKAKVLKASAHHWKGVAKNVAEGTKAVAYSLTYQDLRREIHDRDKTLQLMMHEISRGRKAGRIETLFFKMTGLTF